MRQVPSVFLDTSVLKASVDTRLVFTPEPRKINWGGRECEIDVYRPVYVNPNVRYLEQGNVKRFKDTVALRIVAALAKEGKIRLLVHREVLLELWKLPRVADGGPRFYGAPIEEIEGPVTYRRIVADGSGADHQYAFLARLRHPRFEALQKVCGAYQGDEKPLQRNQLIDAFHVFCAESAAAMYFLTLDDKLVRVVSEGRARKTSVIPITPRRLVAGLLYRRPTWLWSVFRERRRLAKSRRDLTASAQDASDEFFT